MEVNELMIGDLVKNCFGKNERVGQILEDSVMLAYNDMYSFDEIEPIPLTAEILEKNGFEYINDEYGCWILGKLELREREPYNGLFEVEICISKETVYLHYVHELQHALRLCKIDKSIEL